ncbi:MAG: hypothetical protein M3P40_01435 [Actinomycetota bacterium]|nr:hypothetical protein [Actinomycetota bacterium]
MLLLLAGEAGLVLWIVAWSLGMKSIDAFGITITIFIIAAAVDVYLKNKRAKRYEPDDPAGTLTATQGGFSQHV